MLCLSRKPGESIVIDAGDKKITVSVISVHGNKVRLGFEADKTVVIDRTEVRESKEQGRD